MTSPAPLTPAETAAIEKAAAKAAGEGLTPAELAVATAMADRQNRAELAAGYGAAAMPGDFADEARAVVAAVRGPIEEPYAHAVAKLATALDSLGGRIYRDLAGDYAEIHTSDVPKTVDGFNAFAENCLAVLDDPEVKAALDAAVDRQSLSLPASKETPDA